MLFHQNYSFYSENIMRETKTKNEHGNQTGGYNLWCAYDTGQIAKQWKSPTETIRYSS